MPQTGSTSLTIWLVLVLFQIPGAYNGFACLSNPCVHGVCLDDLNSTYFCYCIDGYTGLQCQTNWNDCWSSPCQNGGVCVDGIASFNCTCPSGFVGDVCEFDFNECESNPCWNNGTCIDGPNGYICQCIPGYSGVHCEMDIAVCNTTEEARCLNGGICVEGPGDTFSCTCQPGWEGFLCNSESDECMSAPCQNGAVCIDLHANYECACLFGYAGRNCEEIIQICDKNPCKNGALCIIEDGHSECYCVPDFHGELCQLQYDECQLGPRCLNGGSCIDGIDNFTCSCPPNLTGVLCECLILPNNRLDCTYMSPSTTTIIYPNATTITSSRFETETTMIFSTSEKPRTPTTTISGTITPTLPVPNITAQSTETLTTPYCVTQTPITKATTSTEIPMTASTTSTSQTSRLTSTATPTITVEMTGETVSTTTSIVTITGIAMANTTLTEQPIRTSTEWSLNTTEVSMTSEQGYSEVSTESVKTTTENILSTEEISTTIMKGIETSTPALRITSEISNQTSTTYFTTLGTTISTDNITGIEITEITEIPAISEQSTTIPTIFEITTNHTVEGEATEITVYPTIPTTFSSTQIYNQTITTPFTIGLPSATSTESITTSYLVEYTTPPNITTYRQTSSTSSSIEITTILKTTEETSKFTTEINDRESNRTFPEESTTTTSPPITSFFTDEPLTEYTFLTETPVKSTTELMYSTSIPTIPTTLVSVDCTLLDKRCRNGGTCIFIDESHKCLCPFDAEGPYCEIKLGIKNAAFNGNGYLTHRLPNTQNISIEFEAKTLSATGLLFYAHMDRYYMVLYLENGFLMFKFSCGYQTMLLSELKIPVNNGMAMNIKANLEFSPDFKHCDASIKVNDTLSMTGDQMAKIDKFSNSIARLNLGGVPNDIPYDNIPSGGFVGCMSNFKISGTNVYIYKDAEDGYEITECSSLACLSNPCKNGASCTSKGDSWSCHCRNGFLGKLCDISICDDNPCLYGGTCIPFSSSGYICLCPYGKHGHFCENDLKITEPYFSSTVRGLSSYVAYPLPEGIAQKMEIKFRFTPTTMEQISILLFIGQNGQHDFYSDHLAVSFVKGYIMLTWNMGSGPRRIFTSQPVESGARDYLVQLGFDGRQAWLFAENLGNVTGRSPGTSVQLDILHLLFLGGHDSRNFSGLPHDLPLHSGFSGCIFDIEVKIGSIILPLQGSLKAIGRAVGQCGTTECYERSCQNSGACLHHGSTFMCLCQDNWYGPLCSSKHNLCDANFTKCLDKSRCVPLLANYECDCPMGRVGQYCEKEENITDISFTGVRSFLSTQPVEIDNSKFNIEMEVRVLKDTGLILFVGQKETSFICLSLQNGLLELKVQSSKTRVNLKDPLTVRSSKLLLKGVWHKVQFGVYGRKVYLYVDHVINVGILDHGFMLSLPKDNTYLGGLPDMSLLPAIATSNIPIPFTGCLRHFSVDQRKILFIPENVADSRNVVDCDGTPCGGESCLNGGTCWLDSFMNPHCSCSEPYYGEKCEFITKCTDRVCKNGKCNNTTCSCHIGFEGGFCEIEIKVKTPSFTGKSYIIINNNKPGDKKRNIRNLEMKKLYLNFTTAKNDGLLVWTKRDNTFFGLGLEKGYLKLAYQLSKSHKQIVEIPPYYKLSDGLWHKIELTLDSIILLKIDEKAIEISKTKKEISENATIYTDGVFYIGGFPANTSLVKETNSMFLRSFEGCIEAFGTNMEKIITDFTPFEGSNVHDCKIF